MENINFAAIEKHRISRGLSRRKLAILIWPNSAVESKGFKTKYQNLCNYLNGKNMPYPHNSSDIEKWWERANDRY